MIQDPPNDPQDNKVTFGRSGPREHISQREYVRYQMAIRSRDTNAFHWLHFARRLAEYYQIAILNRIERDEMDYKKRIIDEQNKRVVTAKDLRHVIEKGLLKTHPNGRLGKVYTLPSTFQGSNQYYKKNYANLMTMVRNMGNPTWYFILITIFIVSCITGLSPSQAILIGLKLNKHYKKKKSHIIIDELILYAEFLWIKRKSF